MFRVIHWAGENCSWRTRYPGQSCDVSTFIIPQTASQASTTQHQRSDQHLPGTRCSERLHPDYQADQTRVGDQWEEHDWEIFTTPENKVLTSLWLFLMLNVLVKHHSRNWDRLLNHQPRLRVINTVLIIKIILKKMIMTCLPRSCLSTLLKLLIVFRIFVLY